MARHKNQANAEKAIVEQKEGEKVTTVSSAPLEPLPEHGPSAATAAAVREPEHKGLSKGAAQEAMRAAAAAQPTKDEDSEEVKFLKAQLADAQALLQKESPEAKVLPPGKPLVKKWFRILADKRITGDGGYRGIVRAGSEFSNVARNPKKLMRMGVKLEEITSEQRSQV